MKLINRIPTLFLGISSVLSITTIVSCTSNINNFSKYTNTDIGGLNNFFNPNDNNNLNYEVIKKVENINSGNDELSKKLLKRKTILLSSGGKVNDRSFNQSVWEAISKFSKEINNSQNSYYEADIVSQATQNQAYDYAMAKKFKIWILTGFQQEKMLLNWLEIGNNQERFNELGVIVVPIDWYTTTSKIPRIFGLNFRTQEATFTIGYSAAKFLAQKYPGDVNKNKRILDTFAGGDFSGATNFNYGFIQGISTWNKEQKTNDTKVQISGPIVVDTSFAITTDSRQKVNYIMDGGSNKKPPMVVMPVAGALTSVTIDRAKEKAIGQMVIGVDTDQSLTFPNDAKLILTSAEKRIAIATYKALSILYGIDNDGDIVGDDFLSNETLDKIKNDLPFAENVQGGYAKGFVGTAKSTLSNLEDRKLFNEILNETKLEFFGEDGLGGILPNPPKDNKGVAFGKDPFELNDGNVKINNANANDKKFFDKAIKEINSWT